MFSVSEELTDSGTFVDLGFAGVVIVQPDVIKEFQIPKKNLDLCEARAGPLDTIEPGL
jgi:hypothetical protein